jgi:hypothetical protein
MARNNGDMSTKTATNVDSSPADIVCPKPTLQ